MNFWQTKETHRGYDVVQHGTGTLLTHCASLEAADRAAASVNGCGVVLDVYSKDHKVALERLVEAAKAHSLGNARTANMDLAITEAERVLSNQPKRIELEE